MNTSATARYLFRLDPLIGCGNLLGFAEWLSGNVQGSVGPNWSLLCLDVNALRVVNDRQGQAHGDATLRWIGIVLLEETKAAVYRIGDDEFVAVLVDGPPTTHAIVAHQVFQRLNREADRFGLLTPAAAVAVIHYQGDEKITAADVLIQIGASIITVQKNKVDPFSVFAAAGLHAIADPVALRWVADLIVNRMVSLGEMLDESYHLAYSDPVTGLPNMRAAQIGLETALVEAAATRKPLAILLIDGDDLKRYNAISYAAGDEMIRQLGKTLKSKLRPGDFLARWRVGDEFIVLLPAATAVQARHIGRRFCRTVQEASQKWLLPVTISVGVVTFPDQGQTVDQLLLKAETAVEQAKADGKNRVVASK
jgi:diguanylate cyclase (GGDEF)-like protein